MDGISSGGQNPWMAVFLFLLIFGVGLFRISMLNGLHGKNMFGMGSQETM